MVLATHSFGMNEAGWAAPVTVSSRALGKVFATWTDLSYGLAASNSALTNSTGFAVVTPNGPVARSLSRPGHVAQGSDSHVQSAPKYGFTRSVATASCVQREAARGLSVSEHATESNASWLLS